MFHFLIILFYHVFSLFSNYCLYFLIPAVTIQIFYPTAELVIPTGIPLTEAKSEIETQLVKLEAKISKY